ncbi:MAG: TolC family protein [Terriglobales bacterium]
MKSCRLGARLLLLSLLVPPARAQSRESYSGLLTSQIASGKLPGPQHLSDYVSDGKLHLSLLDAVALTLENNSSVRIQETQVESDKFALLRTYQPFDPQLQGIFDVNRYSYGGTNQLQGVGISSSSTLNSLTQTAQINYTQTFQTGTDISVGLGSAKNSTNSAFYFFNPYFSSTLSFQFKQPLLRNRWKFANTAPLIIARKILQQSRASFEAQVSDAILQVVKQYWAVVQARGDLEVERKSLVAADVSYQRDKRALELGALPPLDIYRSESEVASRRVEMIQGEYVLKQTEDALRMTIGATQDPYFGALDLDLTERPEPEGGLREIDAATALKEALAQRPEFLAARYALDNDDTSIRLARNHLQPDLSLTGFYQSNGLGGNQFSLTTGQLISRGGLGSSFSQLFGFGFPGYGVKLTLNLPVKNRAAQAELGSALVSRHRDLYSSQQVRELVALEVSNSIHQLEQAKLTVAAGKTALDLAQKALVAEQRKYELGAQTIFFVLDAQTRLAQAESSLLQAQISYRIAVAAVDHATGSLLQPYHVEIAELSK